jgi:hypothetical protein
MTAQRTLRLANLGYLTGEHVPDAVRWPTPWRPGTTCSSATLGDGTRARRRAGRQGRDRVDFTPVTPIGSSPAARDRQQLVDELNNHWYVDPIGGRGYPQYTVDRLAWARQEVRSGDMDLIARPIDMLGINFYTRQMVGVFEGEREDRGAATAMDWEIHPPALGDLLRGLHDTHHFPRYLITENGAAMPDNVRVDGRVIDTDRLEYIAAHLGEVHQAMEDGVPIEGYFAWSLLDNFEWAHGYGPKFGPGRRRHGDPAPHAEAERPVVRRRSPEPARSARRRASPRPRLAWAAMLDRRPGRSAMPRRMCRQLAACLESERSSVARCALSGGTLIRAGRPRKVQRVDDQFGEARPDRLATTAPGCDPGRPRIRRWPRDAGSRRAPGSDHQRRQQARPW